VDRVTIRTVPVVRSTHDWITELGEIAPTPTGTSTTASKLDAKYALRRTSREWDMLDLGWLVAVRPISPPLTICTTPCHGL